MDDNDAPKKRGDGINGSAVFTRVFAEVDASHTRETARACERRRLREIKRSCPLYASSVSTQQRRSWRRLSARLEATRVYNVGTRAHIGGSSARKCFAINGFAGCYIDDSDSARARDVIITARVGQTKTFRLIEPRGCGIFLLAERAGSPFSFAAVGRAD